jgi:hypothetical protein
LILDPDPDPDPAPDLDRDLHPNLGPDPDPDPDRGSASGISCISQTRGFAIARARYARRICPASCGPRTRRVRRARPVAAIRAGGQGDAALRDGTRVEISRRRFRDLTERLSG